MRKREEEQIAENEEITETTSTQSSLLWVDEYTPKNFADLVSDDVTFPQFTAFFYRQSIAIC